MVTVHAISGAIGNDLSLRLLQVLLFVCALAPLVFGTYQFFVGFPSLKSFGALLTRDDMTDPLVNSQYRFLAAVWFGYCPLLLLFISDIGRYAPAIKILLLILFVGGIGRIMSMVQFGVPEPSVGAYFISTMMGLELALAAIQLVLLSRISVGPWKNLKN